MRKQHAGRGKRNKASLERIEPRSSHDLGVEHRLKRAAHEPLGKAINRVEAHLRQLQPSADLARHRARRGQGTVHLGQESPRLLLRHLERRLGQQRAVAPLGYGHRGLEHLEDDGLGNPSSGSDTRTRGASGTEVSALGLAQASLNWSSTTK